MNVNEIRKEFPILHQEVNNRPLVYLDNAASSQKPLAVIDAISDYYKTIHANVHRGVHHLSQKATDAYEGAREDVRRFLNASHTREIIFTAGTTDSINLVSQTWARKHLQQGDEVIVSHLEHHSNIVPWQMVCEEKGAVLKVIEVNDAGEMVMASFEKLLSSRTKIVAVNHVSNTLGTINPIAEIIKKAHAVGAIVCVDGAQAAPHMQADVQDLDVDFYAISSHKMYGPTGIGVLYGKEALLDDSPPWRGGGEMIKTVSFERTTYNSLPHKFEAGTPHVEGAIGLGVAIRWMERVGVENIRQHEDHVLAYATEKLLAIEGLRIFGTSKNKASVISFLVDEIHPYDIGTLLDKMGIAVRTGHHCTEPLMDLYNIPGTVRASFAAYNTKGEVDVLVAGLERALGMLR
ncbi:MAG: cysteine desulfurase [Flavobacteriales bacterium]|nr:cysteine desulfurase [Flavobacteriales bacterium]